MGYIVLVKCPCSGKTKLCSCCALFAVPCILDLVYLCFCLNYGDAYVQLWSRPCFGFSPWFASVHILIQLPLALVSNLFALHMDIHCVHAMDGKKMLLEDLTLI